MLQVNAFTIGRSSRTDRSIFVGTKDPVHRLAKTILPRSRPIMPTTTTLKSTALPLCLSNLPTWVYYSLLHLLGGNIGTPIVIRATKSWYKRIPLPGWTPPNFVFAPVWTILYSLMGVSVSRILKAGVLNNNVIDLWKVHFALNVVWAPVFFGFQYLRLGLLINIALVSTLLIVLRLFYSIEPVAAYLQVPYLLWLLYATKLNQAICKLNPTIGGINEARLQADLCADGDGYNDAMLEYDIAKLQAAAAKYAGM
jgi:tryptophan-rich sensory protein